MRILNNEDDNDLIVKFLYSVDINESKYNILKSVAKIALLYRNILSKEFYDNYKEKLFYQEITKDKFVKETYHFYKSLNWNGYEITNLGKTIGSNTFQSVQRQVFSNYLTYLSNQKFHIPKFLSEFVKNGIIYLVLDYKSSIKNYFNKLKKHLLSVNNILLKECPEYSTIISNKEKLSETTKYKTYEIYLNVCKRNSILDSLKLIEKYGYNRVIKTIIKIQKYLIRKIPLLNYSSLTFSSINMLGNNRPMIEKVNNLSIANAVIHLSIPNFDCRQIGDEKILNILTRYNDKYHDNLLTNYKTRINSLNQNCTQYTLMFVEGKRQIKLILKMKPKITKQEILDNLSCTLEEDKILGLDINTTKRFFQLSDEYFIKYDQKLLNHYSRIQYKRKQRIKNKKLNNNNPNLDNKREKLSMAKLKRQMKCHAERKIGELKKYCLKHGIKHLVMEDLSLYTGESKISTVQKESHLKHTEIAKVLHINDMKNLIPKILNKAGITVSFVNPAYTSRTCSYCHHISKGNRKSQQSFICENCGYEENADVNASKNIKERIINTYLRERLEYYKNKCFHGRKMKAFWYIQKIYKEL